MTSGIPPERCVPLCVPQPLWGAEAAGAEPVLRVALPKLCCPLGCDLLALKIGWGDPKHKQ